MLMTIFTYDQETAMMEGDVAKVREVTASLDQLEERADYLDKKRTSNLAVLKYVLVLFLVSI